MEQTTELAAEFEETLSNCAGSHNEARIVEATPNQIRITNIPHSAGHMLPGGMSTLSVLGNHWGDWDIDYVDNGDTLMYGSKADKDVVITRTA